MVVQEQNGKQQRANYSTVNRPVLKAGSNVGFSWNKVREMSKRSKIQIVPGMLAPNDPNSKPITENNQFSQEDLELQWMSMCNRMPQKLSAIATRMKNMNPKIGEFPNVKVMVDNQVILEQMQQIADKSGGALFVLYPPSREQLREIQENGLTLPVRTCCIQ